MKELSLHILDLVQNSVQANAANIEITIRENTSMDTYEISIKDDGSGMNKETLKSVLDPFFTTKKKKTGLGIPLLTQHAELSGGSVDIYSSPNNGCEIHARFGLSSIDRQPLGNIAGTLTGLIRAYPEVEFIYSHEVDKHIFHFSTIDLKKELDGIPIGSKEIIQFVNELITENLKEIRAAS